MDIRDGRDYNAMLSHTSCKCGEYVVIAMGCAKAVVEGEYFSVNRAIFGTSVLRRMPEINAAEGDSVGRSRTLARGFEYVIQQCRTGWSDVLQCQTDKFEPVSLPSRDCEPLVMNDQDKNLSTSRFEDRTRFCFRFKWNPANLSSTRQYTKDANNTSDDVLGELSLHVPVVALVGAHMLGEFRNSYALERLALLQTSMIVVLYLLLTMKCEKVL